ncbi:hypothetical protein H5185_04890, partial [Shewanella sp. SG44-6]|uniref:hypothetical protein n=1 Tax=Shewanella sp. SG44-6 TaxID=2760959 RepID=UPI0016036B7C
AKTAESTTELAKPEFANATANNGGTLAATAANNTTEAPQSLEKTHLLAEDQVLSSANQNGSAANKDIAEGRVEPQLASNLVDQSQIHSSESEQANSSSINRDNNFAQSQTEDGYKTDLGNNSTADQSLTAYNQQDNTADTGSVLTRSNEEQISGQNLAATTTNDNVVSSTQNGNENNPSQTFSSTGERVEIQVVEVESRSAEASASSKEMYNSSALSTNFDVAQAEGWSMKSALSSDNTHVNSSSISLPSGLQLQGPNTDLGPNNNTGIPQGANVIMKG